jgi:hypothetical protein
MFFKQFFKQVFKMKVHRTAAEFQITEPKHYVLWLSPLSTITQLFPVRVIRSNNRIELVMTEQFDPATHPHRRCTPRPWPLGLQATCFLLIVFLLVNFDGGIRTGIASEKQLVLARPNRTSPTDCMASI